LRDKSGDVESQADDDDEEEATCCGGRCACCGDNPNVTGYIEYLFVFGLMFLAPPLLTHIVPMFPVYCWVFIVFGFTARLLMLGMSLLASLGRMVGWELDEDSAALEWVKAFLTKPVWYFSMVLLLQSAFNWGVLVYDGGGYFDVIKHELSLRSPSCYFSHLTNDFHQLISFAGLL